MKTGEYESKFGQMYKYTVQLEGEAEAVELSQKPSTPAPSGEIEGTIEDTQYGRKFRKEKPAFSGSSKNDPSVQKSIIRQNALTNAVNYCIAKSAQDKEYELSGKHVIEVATYFAKYSQGEVTVVTESKPKEPKEEPLPPEPEKEEEEEINLDDMPF